MTGDRKRTLPLLPHPGHLRKQAKARLAAMRQKSPNTRLAEAQALIAREYGFRDWATLQTEVKRRAAGPGAQRASLRRANLVSLHAQRFQTDGMSDEEAGIRTPLDFFRLGVAVQIGLVFAALTGMALVCVAIGPPRGVIATTAQLGQPLVHLIRTLL